MRSYFGSKYVSESGAVRHIGGTMVLTCEEEEGEEEGVFLTITKREKEKILRRKVMSSCLCLVQRRQCGCG